jgi:nucleoid-associated protein EbfC
VSGDDVEPAEAEEAKAESAPAFGAFDSGALAGLQGLLSELETTVEQLQEEDEEASETIVEGTAAGRSVIVRLTGGLDAVSVTIAPALVDPADVETLEDAVLAALRDALDQALDLRRQVADDIEETQVDLSQILGQLGGLPGFGGLGLPDLGNLPSPEDLIAGLAGVLGDLSGGMGPSPGAGLAGAGSALSEPPSPDRALEASEVSDGGAEAPVSEPPGEDGTADPPGTA